MASLRTINDSTGIRLLLSSGVGILVGLLTLAAGVGRVALLLGWDAGVTVFVIWLFAIILPLDAPKTHRFAGREDPSRIWSNTVLILASFASIGAVGAALVDAHSKSGAAVLFLTGVSIVSVILSWLLIHTIFTLHYARIFYNDRIDGTIDFGDGDKSYRPSYWDFVYVAFTVGMTYQIADTTITGSALRRTVIRHALLSYVFGTLIVATTVSIIAGLGS